MIFYHTESIQGMQLICDLTSCRAQTICLFFSGYLLPSGCRVFIGIGIGFDSDFDTDPDFDN